MHVYTCSEGCSIFSNSSLCVHGTRKVVTSKCKQYMYIVHIMHTRSYVHVYTYSHMFLCTCTCSYVHVHVLMYMYMYILYMCTHVLMYVLCIK